MVRTMVANIPGARLRDAERQLAMLRSEEAVNEFIEAHPNESKVLQQLVEWRRAGRTVPPLARVQRVMLWSDGSVELSATAAPEPGMGRAGGRPGGGRGGPGAAGGDRRGLRRVGARGNRPTGAGPGPAAGDRTDREQTAGRPAGEGGFRAAPGDAGPGREGAPRGDRRGPGGRPGGRGPRREDRGAAGTGPRAQRFLYSETPADQATAPAPEAGATPPRAPRPDRGRPGGFRRGDRDDEGSARGVPRAGEGWVLLRPGEAPPPGPTLGGLEGFEEPAAPEVPDAPDVAHAVAQPDQASPGATPENENAPEQTGA